jgi:uncharacterized protein YqgC (DUF456 family)
VEAELGPLLVVTLLVMLVGLGGSVLPALPGVPLIFFSALVYAFLTGFDVIGAPVLIPLALFAAAAFVADIVATSYGARRFGASNWGTIGGAVGGILGALAGLLLAGIGSIFGLILGTIAGVFAGEYLRRSRQPQGSPQPEIQQGAEWRRASRATGGVLVGYAASAVVQGILGLLSVAIFVLGLFY